MEKLYRVIDTECGDDFWVCENCLSEGHFDILDEKTIPTESGDGECAICGWLEDDWDNDNPTS